MNGSHRLKDRDQQILRFIWTVKGIEPPDSFGKEERDWKTLCETAVTAQDRESGLESQAQKYSQVQQLVFDKHERKHGGGRVVLSAADVFTTGHPQAGVDPSPAPTPAVEMPQDE